MNRSHTASLLMLIALTFVAVFAANAQVAGRLTGSVIDATGAAVPGASVSVFVAGGKEPVLTGSTNAAGLFSFPAVRPETYDISISATGFNKATIRQIKVDPLQETG